MALLGRSYNQCFIGELREHCSLGGEVINALYLYLQSPFFYITVLLLLVVHDPIVKLVCMYVHSCSSVCRNLFCYFGTSAHDKICSVYAGKMVCHLFSCCN